MLVKTSQIKTLKKPSGFIVLEGVNGAGKSSLLKKISKYLKSKNKQYLLTREPGSGSLGKDLRELVLNNTEKLPALSELFLFAADRNYHVNKIILPALKKNKLVISDRYYYSTTAFQGYGRKINLKSINIINQLAIEGLKPDLVLLLDLDPMIGLQRNRQSDKDRDSFEEEELSFHQKIRQGFLKQAKSLPEKFIILDASQSADQVWKSTKKILDLYLLQIKTVK